MMTERPNAELLVVSNGFITCGASRGWQIIAFGRCWPRTCPLSVGHTNVSAMNGGRTFSGVRPHINVCRDGLPVASGATPPALRLYGYPVVVPKNMGHGGLPCTLTALPLPAV